MSATWSGHCVLRLAIQPIERRLGVVREWNSVDRAGVDDPGNGAHLLQLRVDEGYAPVEVLVAEQRRLEGQQLLAPDSEIGIPQMLEGLQQQAAARQQHHGERGLDHDERMLEPMAARAGRAASSVAQSFLRSDSRPAQRGRESEDQCCGDR